MAQTREIKRRLKSIKNTQKTTKAMELVAGSKMRKAVGGALQTRTYHTLAWDIVRRLHETMDLKPDHPLEHFFHTQTPDHKPTHTTIVIMTSNRGLCGAFNTNIVRVVMEYVEKHGKDNVEIIGIGKRGVGNLIGQDIPVHLAYTKEDSATNDLSILEIAEYAHQQFSHGKTHAVYIAYTEYFSALKQAPVLKQLYPLVAPEVAETVEHNERLQEKVKIPTEVIEYLYEPTSLDVLTYLLPRIAEVELYQALLESNASEHSARMVAMKNATEAAGEMADELLLVFNRARQASITKEIAEIAAGTAAVSGV